MTALITPILHPFAYGRSDNVQPAPTPGAPDDIANQDTGFPVSQMTALSTPGATPVKEEELNGVLNFYTDILYKLGAGYQFTFDSSLSAALGGYSEGSVLWNAVGKNRQVSLIDNNIYNFVTNPSYVNDGVHWMTVTDTPSISNPNTNFLSSFCVSTVSGHYQSRIWQQQLSGGVVDGCMETRLESIDINGSTVNSIAQFRTTYTDAEGAIAPSVWSFIQKGGSTTGASSRMYFNSADSKIRIDTAVFNNISTSSVNTGIRLEQTHVPSIIYDSLSALTIDPDSIMISRWFKPLHDASSGITGFAIWNGSFWTVWLGGKLEYHGTSVTSITLNFNLSSAFGISGITPSTGPCTVDGALSSAQISGAAGVSGTTLELIATLNTGATNAALNFTIVFKCTTIS